MGFWIEGSTANVDRLEMAAQAANDALQEYNINAHAAFLSHQAKLAGEHYNKKLDAAWLYARDRCFLVCYGEQTSWERGAHLTFK